MAEVEPVLALAPALAILLGDACEVVQTHRERLAVGVRAARLACRVDFRHRVVHILAVLAEATHDDVTAVLPALGIRVIPGALGIAHALLYAAAGRLAIRVWHLRPREVRAEAADRVPEHGVLHEYSVARVLVDLDSDEVATLLRIDRVEVRIRGLALVEGREGSEIHQLRSVLRAGGQRKRFVFDLEALAHNGINAVLADVPGLRVAVLRDDLGHHVLQHAAETRQIVVLLREGADTAAAHGPVHVDLEDGQCPHQGLLCDLGGQEEVGPMSQVEAEPGNQHLAEGRRRHGPPQPLRRVGLLGAPEWQA
mmetsp:Transcript_109290/g.293981  ORF Transcript_109290/g.293981 Transcript_109290/m.293981 type:complete len:310 (+) Transcript_109290:820-1749(+)